MDIRVFTFEEWGPSLSAPEFLRGYNSSTEISDTVSFSLAAAADEASLTIQIGNGSVRINLPLEELAELVDEMQFEVSEAYDYLAD